jgi:hypothetical protein
MLDILALGLVRHNFRFLLGELFIRQDKLSGRSVIAIKNGQLESPSLLILM